MPDNTDSFPDTGDIPFQFGLDIRSNKPDTFHLCLLIDNTWYETNAVFSEHRKAIEFICQLNNAVITRQN